MDARRLMAQVLTALGYDVWQDLSNPERQFAAKGADVLTVQWRTNMGVTPLTVNEAEAILEADKTVDTSQMEPETRDAWNRLCASAKDRIRSWRRIPGDEGHLVAHDGSGAGVARKDP